MSPESRLPVSSWHLRQAVRALAAGGVIAYPTEAVYGLGCDPLNGYAVLRLLSLKARALNKGLIVIAARFDQLRPFVEEPDTEVMQRLQASWPGPTTWLLPARADVPDWLKGQHDTLAVRVTGHNIASALCMCYGGPVVSTSANTAGTPPARSALAVRRHFDDRLDYVLSGRVGGEKGPSEIRDGLTNRIIRPGPRDPGRG